MEQILDYVHTVFSMLVNLLNIKPFPDFPVSFLQIILCAIFIKYVLRLIFGGFKEMDMSSNWMNGNSVSQAINNNQRKKQIAFAQNYLNAVNAGLDDGTFDGYMIAQYEFDTGRRFRRYHFKWKDVKQLKK